MKVASVFDCKKAGPRALRRWPSPMASNTVRRALTHCRTENCRSAVRCRHVGGKLRIQRKVSDAGRATYNARTGAHEDQHVADRAIAKTTGLGLRDAVSIAAGVHSHSYPKATPCGSVSVNHSSASSSVAIT